MAAQLGRRGFLKWGALAAAATLWPAMSRTHAASASLSKVNVGFIGVGGRGWGDLDDCVKAGCNVVALCDVDSNHLATAANRFPKARTFSDYRKMLEQQKEIEAVVVATPDHHHFPASMMALKLGKHVYCEKPLTHSIWEARALAQAARTARVATQMGTQGHATERFRLLVEWVQAGIIGKVQEVHIWTDRPAGWWPQGLDRPKETKPAPKHLDWDLWLGPAPHREYHDSLHPFNWRGWWDFGTGALGDIGCHSMDLPWTALRLTAPTTVHAFQFGGKTESAPLWSDVLYQFPARGDLPPVKVWWYDGRNRRTAKGSAEYRSIAMLRELAEIPSSADLPENGHLYIGDKGKLLLAGDNGPRLVPESRMKDFKPPARTLPRSPGHHLEWLNACRGSGAPGVNFEYAGPLTEAVLLGNLSIRLGKPIEWDSANLKCRNAPEADAIIRRQYRKGWEI